MSPYKNLFSTPYLSAASNDPDAHERLRDFKAASKTHHKGEVGKSLPHLYTSSCPYFIPFEYPA